jgi:hypothetical protein
MTVQECQRLRVQIPAVLIELDTRRQFGDIPQYGPVLQSNRDCLCMLPLLSERSMPILVAAGR